MNQVHIITDSTANLEDGFFKEHSNLHKVCLKLRLDGREYAEDTLGASELFRRIKAGCSEPQTTPPTIEEFAEIFERIVAAGDEAVAICISGGLSDTFQHAKLAAQKIDSKKIFVIDSQSAAAGEARLVRLGVELAEAGRSASDIAGRLLLRAEYTCTYLVPDSLAYLHRGGRIGGAEALMGTMLQIKPVLMLLNGRIALLDKVRTRSKALSILLERLKKAGDVDSVDIAYSGSRVRAEKFKQQVLEVCPEQDIPVCEVSSVLAAHVGSGMLSLFFQQKI